MGRLVDKFVRRWRMRAFPVTPLVRDPSSAREVLPRLGPHEREAIGTGCQRDVAGGRRVRGAPADLRDRG